MKFTLQRYMTVDDYSLQIYRRKTSKSTKILKHFSSRNAFRFFSIDDFLVLVHGFLNSGSVNIFKFFLSERASRDAGHHRVLFKIKLYFLLGVRTTTLIFGAFYGSLNL